MTTPGITRRDFLRVSLLAGGAMLIEACTRSVTSTTTTTTSTTGTTTTAGPATTGAGTTTTEPVSPGAVFEPNLSVRIDATGAVTVTGHRSEMGQGILTAMAMIVAEELDADWSAVRVEQADADSAYGSQVTGGSTSVADSWRMLRLAGAEARGRLVAAAAARWEVDVSECSTASGEVKHDASERALGYGDLIEEAAGLDPESVPMPGLKDPGEFRLIGTPLPLAHSPAVIDGSAVFCSDVTLPGMRYAAVAYPPVLGGGVRGFDPGRALAVPGVEQVFEIPGGIAVVAVDTWAAWRGRDVLQAEWDPGDGGDRSSAVRRTELLRVTEADRVYDHPFYAHATIEPMCCVVDLGADSAEVWAPVQVPEDAARRVAQASGLSRSAVTLHVPLAGGRFGRGLEPDFVDDAVRVAVGAGVPIKLVWTREDDIRRDRFHPLAVVGAMSDPGDPLRSIRVSSQTGYYGVPEGPWRAVSHFTNAFAHESYVDELALSLGLDPVDARLELLDGRAAETVRVAAGEAGWGDPLPSGWGRGIAHHSTWGVTQVAQVAEVSVEGSEIRVHRVVCAVDCGIVVNPDTVRAQMEGGIVFGLTAALKNGIDIEAGRVVQGNFDDYPVLRFGEMPVIEVHIVPSSANPSGIGEMGVPPIAPAVANAVFDATGQRLRSLPLRLEA